VHDLEVMSRIQLLPEHVASQVAAGEVVERPAAVVKELVENSIDAKATRIEVLTRRGGVSLIQVTDNGIGMDRDDALLCLERHATSKIRTGTDLASIHTLGFRGEAIPSIASVSRFRLSTREHDALVGTEILVNGGRMETVRDGGDAPGTQIEVRSLFFNLPARRKFLRTESTEASHVDHQLQLLALGHPSISFVHIQDDRLVYQLAPAVSLLDRIRDLNGPAFCKELLPVVPYETEGLQISGYIGKAGMSRSSRQQQLSFLNGRAIENITISKGLREGYHTALMKGQHPVCFLFIRIDPEAVDVNVHPAKREVRFRSPGEIREAVLQTVKRTLESDRANWSAQFTPSASSLLPSSHRHPGPDAPSTAPVGCPPHPSVQKDSKTESDQHNLPLPIQPRPALVLPDSRHQPSPSPFAPAVPSQAADLTPPAPSSHDSEGRTNKESLSPPAPVPDTFRFLGVLGKLYVLIENSSGLVLVDQHAAHERILYEEMQRRMETQGVPSQRLLLPITLQLGPRDADWITRHQEMLERAGIALEHFGGGSFKVDALPTFIRSEDPTQLLHDIIDDLRDTNTQSARLRLGEDMIAKTVCRHAVKANDTLREPELAKLVENLLACELPYCCPHGRPTMIQIGYLELEKKFGRKA
jgi:DNA mismatch repair protein MutL